MKKRDWTAARDKVEREGVCRVCGTGSLKLDAAHVIPRSLNPTDGAMLEESIVPLCRACHTATDSHELDLLPYLTVEEQAAAVHAAQGIERARQIITGERL